MEFSSGISLKWAVADDETNGEVSLSGAFEGGDDGALGVVEVASQPVFECVTVFSHWFCLHFFDFVAKIIACQSAKVLFFHKTEK